MYVDKQFDFTIPLTDERLELLLEVINYVDNREVSHALIPRLLTSIATMLARANFNNTETFVNKIHDSTQYYLNRFDSRIFTYGDEDNTSEVYRQYQQFLNIKDKIKEQEKAE